MTKLIQNIVFGPRARGEKLPPPTVRTVYLINQPSEIEWVKEFKIGSRYGHRGSFYDSRNKFGKSVASFN